MSFYHYIVLLIITLNVLLIFYLCERRKINKEPFYRKPNKIKFYLQMIFLLLVICGRFLGVIFNKRLECTFLLLPIAIIIMGKFFNKYSLKYCFLICCVVISCYALSESLIIDSDLKKMKSLVIEIMAFALILSAVRSVKKFPNKITTLNWLIVIITLIINSINLIFTSKYFYNYMVGFQSVFLIMLILGAIMLLGELCSVTMAAYYLEVKRIESDANLQIGQVKLQYEYYKQLSKDMDEVRKLSHDIRGHMIALEGIWKSERNKAYTNGILSQLDNFEAHCDTGNQYIDRILYKKKKDAAENDIQFKIYVNLSEFNKIKDEDLSSIFFNLIDNAMKECIAIRRANIHSNISIVVKAGIEKGFLFITCENSVRNIGASNFKKLNEAKIEGCRGYGIKNIISAVRRYNGNYSIKIDNSYFKFHIIIPSEFKK